MADPGTSVPFRNADFGRFRKVGWIRQMFNSTFTFVNIYPFLTKIVPLESSHSQLSNGTKIIKNGAILRKLWPNRNKSVSKNFFRFPIWIPSWSAKNSYTDRNLEIWQGRHLSPPQKRWKMTGPSRVFSPRSEAARGCDLLRVYIYDHRGNYTDFRDFGAERGKKTPAAGAILGTQRV